MLALPAWRAHRTQPIDVRDVRAYLVAAATTPHAAGGLSLDIAGPETLTYDEMIERIADLMLVRRPALRLGRDLTPVAAPVAAAIAGEDLGFIAPLMESLSGDLLARDERAPALLGRAPPRLRPRGRGGAARVGARRAAARALTGAQRLPVGCARCPS